MTDLARRQQMEFQLSKPALTELVRQTEQMQLTALNAQYAMKQIKGLYIQSVYDQEGAKEIAATIRLASQGQMTALDEMSNDRTDAIYRTRINQLLDEASAQIIRQMRESIIKEPTFLDTLLGK